jgi:hypothetical protein
MHTIGLHNIVSVQITPTKSLGIQNAEHMRECYHRDIILTDDRGNKTTITIFADELPEQINLEAKQ